MARHDPERMLRLVLDPRRPGGAPSGRAFWRAFIDCNDDDLVALARSVGSYQLVRFLHILPPRRRVAVYSGVLGPRDLVGAGWPISLLDELPTVARAAEARRLLALPSVADDPHLRLQVTARLGWVEGRPALAAALRRPTADERAEAYPMYVGCAGATRDPEVIGVMLASLDRLTNEQDPVRAGALTAIADIPAWLFREIDAGRIQALMTDAVQARDSSGQTRAAVGRLAGALLREGAISGRPSLTATGLGGIELLTEHEVGVGLRGLPVDLPHDTEHAVFAALRPRLEAEARRGRYAIALAMATMLGRRAWAIDGLQDLVRRAVSAKADHVVRQAVALRLAPPEHRDERVAEIFGADRSTITIPAVQAVISRRRTDLLDTVFRRPLHGRFLDRGVRYIPLFRGCFDAWLPRQTRAYADLLVGLATAPDVSIYQRASAVATLGRLPGTVEQVRGFVDDPEVSVQEAALAALAWTDRPADVIPDLLAHADGDRARVAIYALARCSRFISADEVASRLEPLLHGPKVTARKEAVRVLAESRVPDVARVLAEVWSAPGEHRDVRRAVVPAGRFLLDDERIWDLLRGSSVEPALATALLDVSPLGLPVRHRPRFAALVGTVAGSADPDTSRAGLTVLPQWVQWAVERAWLSPRCASWTWTPHPPGGWR